MGGVKLQEWIDEATEVYELVGSYEDSASAEDQEFRRRAPRFLIEGLDALTRVLAMAQEAVDDGTDYDAADFIAAVIDELGVTPDA